MNKNSHMKRLYVYSRFYSTWSLFIFNIVSTGSQILWFHFST